MSELSRLKLRCRRGMKELDVLFQRYLEVHYPSASAEEIQQLNELLDMQDPLLFAMILDMEPVPGTYAELVAKLRKAHD